MSKKILIVEDEVIISMILEQSLVAMGFEVCDKIDKGENVLEAVVKHNPDLILMDIMLKGEMTGIDASAVVKESFDIPIIFLTAYSNKDVFNKAKITNPYGYIIKPFEEKQLEITVEIALYKYDVEKRLVESEKKYRKLTESIPQIVFECDENGKVIFLNETGLNSLSYSSSSLEEGVYFTNWFSKEDLYEIGIDVSNFSNNKKIKQGVECVLINGNKNRYVQLYSNTIIEDEKFKGLRGVIVDITEKRNNLLRLEESERRYRGVLENIELYALKLDLSGNITFINSTLLNVLQKKEEELIGENWFNNFLLEKEKEYATKQFYENLKSKIVSTKFDSKIVLENGRTINVSWSSIVLFNIKGEVVGKAYVGVDVTQSLLQKKKNKAMSKLDSIMEKRNRKKMVRNYVTGQEAEKRRISRDLHDGIGQSMIAIKFGINSLKNKKNIDLDHINNIHTMVDDTINEIRKVSYNLLPSVLTDFGFIAGIEKIVNTFENSECDIKLKKKGDEFRFPEEVEVSLFRIFQEGLNNALRHSGCEEIQVYCDFNEVGGKIIIKDDGVGMNDVIKKSEQKFGNGLHNMYERAEMIGAKLSIISDNNGTTLTVAYNQ